MAISEIKEIRIFPPLAIARLGSSEEPMHNYEVSQADDSGFRQLTPSETFIINPDNGAIAGVVTPQEIRFRDEGGKIKPVSPFFELWARFEDDGDFLPLTTAELNELNIDIDDIKWSIIVANRKMVRRTGDINDAINASQLYFSDHKAINLNGTANNFKTGSNISFGKVQFIKPTEDFPEIRFRFTPPTGKVFGHQENDVIPAEQAVYDNQKGGWDNYTNDNSFNQLAQIPAARLFTSPGNIFAVDRVAYARREIINLGYFDDTCDGIIKVEIEGINVPSALARISSGPPDFAPDSYHVRTVADELKQIVDGPEVKKVTVQEVIDVMQRVVETVRLFNTEYANSTIPFWNPDAIPVFRSGAPYKNAYEVHDKLLKDLSGLNAPQNHPGREKAVQALGIMESRLREYTETARYDNSAAAKMPALMRDGTGELLAITRRQMNFIRVAKEQFKYIPSGQDTPKKALLRLINSFQWASGMHASIKNSDDEMLSALFSDSEKLIGYLLTESAKGKDAEEIGIAGDLLVSPGNVTNSAFVKLLEYSSHVMNSYFLNYADAISQDNGIDIVKKWISSLPTS